MNTATLSPLSFYEISSGAIPSAKKLLETASLPTSDISANVRFFGLFDDEKSTIAIGGLEAYGELALLRSVCVPDQQRGKGYGKQLIQSLEVKASSLGVMELFLLTTTAKDFFLDLGYDMMNRNQAPEAIRMTSEFSGLCPSNASFMHKRLNVAPGNR